MPLQILSQQIALNQTGLFRFSGPVAPGNYVVGSGGISLSYPNYESYQVQNIGSSLAHGMQSADTVFVTVTGDISDGQGHGIDGGNSGCTVNVVAWVGTTDSPTLAMANFPGISAGAPRTFTAPPNTRQIFTFLSGLNIQLADSEDVTSYSASTSSDFNSIDGTITISGDSQLNGVHGTVDVGVLVLTARDDGYQVFTTSCPINPPWPCSIWFSPAIDAACASLTSFGGEFTDKKVLVMAAGVHPRISPPLPVNVVEAYFAMDIIGKAGSGTSHPNVNACFIGINGPAGIEDAFVPTDHARWLRGLKRDERFPTP